MALDLISIGSCTLDCIIQIKDILRFELFDKEIVKKYGLKIGRDDRDVWHIMCVHNYLRCFGGESLPHIVTSDPNFKKIIKTEGYGVIDPKEITPKQLKKMWE